MANFRCTKDIVKTLKKLLGENMIVCIGSIKGGVGKSITAVNLTAIRSKNRRVLLIDADDQGTAANWVEHRENLGVKTPWTTIRLKAGAVRTEVLKLVNDYDDVIIDVGGRDTAALRAALTISDVFLTPFQPKSFDIWTSNQVASLANDAKIINPKLNAYCFINCAGTGRGADNKDAQDILAQINGLSLLPITIGHRKAFSNSTANGLSVIEEKKLDPKAVSEIRQLHDVIFTSKMTEF